ncbi:hypothetical protein DL96DRAFT_1616089, partial [Flagelloscypha sp. PMI_526]
MMDPLNQTTAPNAPFLLTHLPDDILELITLHLSSSDLEECCLSNKTLQQFARPHVFASILLEDIFDVESLAMAPVTQDKNRRISDFRGLLDGSPDIGPLVRSLTVLYTSHPDQSKHTFNVSGWAQNFESVLAKMTNLVTFSIGRLGVRWTTHLNWEKDVPTNITYAVRRVLTLPSLRNFDFHDSFDGGTAQNFLDRFRLDGQCFVDSLELTGQDFDDSEGIPSSVSPYQAKIARLGLSYVTPSTQQTLIPSLLSPASTFNVRNLTCAAFTNIDSDDSPWISDLLDGQETSYRLQCIELLDPYDCPGNDLSFVKSLQRFTNLHTIITSFDENTEERDECEINATLWIQALPENVLSQVETFILAWVPSTPFEQSSPRPMLPSFDRLLTSGAMLRLRSVIIRIQKTVTFFDLDATMINKGGLEGIWYEIAVALLPKTCNNGIVSIDTSLI